MVGLSGVEPEMTLDFKSSRFANLLQAQKQKPPATFGRGFDANLAATTLSASLPGKPIPQAARR
jgi:hypothetical protein